MSTENSTLDRVDLLARLRALLERDADVVTVPGVGGVRGMTSGVFMTRKLLDGTSHLFLDWGDPSEPTSCALFMSDMTPSVPTDEQLNLLATHYEAALARLLSAGETTTPRALGKDGKPLDNLCLAMHIQDLAERAKDV